MFSCMKREPTRSSFQRVIRICDSRPAAKSNKIADDQAKRIELLSDGLMSLRTFHEALSMIEKLVIYKVKN